MRSGGRSTTALIIPALNEAAVIAHTLRSIPSGLFDAIIVADNGSTDGTGAIALAEGAIVAVEPRRGYGAACLAAMARLPAGTAVVAFMQADGSEDPAEAALLLTPIQDGRADIAIGSRTLGRVELGALLPHQRFGNRVATTLMKWIYGHAFTDLGPFRAIRVDALRQLEMRDRDYGWTVEMQVKALKKRLRVVEIPVTYRRRKAGENKVSGNVIASIRAGLKILWTVLRLSAGPRN